MCLAIPGKILKVNGQIAEVDFDGIQKEVNIALLSDAKIGEHVIVHAGFAIEKVEEDTVSEIEKYLK
ncbi:MAG: HypC/HybG/HupF family hydrogenase formation chaperone [Parcubacteria group bacterium]